MEEGRVWGGGNYFLTPSQPRRSYQAETDRQTDIEGERDRQRHNEGETGRQTE